jgi:hypothetical protein
MNIFFPVFKLKLLPPMLGIAFLGALLAGLYGVIHDQVTYSISEEYFTKLKFDQFHYANFGFPSRVLVGEVGFLATWWVGFISAWFLARIAVPAWSSAIALRRCILGFTIILGAALAAAVAAYFLGLNHSGDFSNWQVMCNNLGVTDIRNFVRAAYIHNGSYIGGFIGLISAIMRLLRIKNKDQSPTAKTW